MNGYRCQAYGNKMVSSVRWKALMEASSCLWMSCVPQMKRTDDTPRPWLRGGEGQQSGGERLAGLRWPRLTQWSGCTF